MQLEGIGVNATNTKPPEQERPPLVMPRRQFLRVAGAAAAVTVIAACTTAVTSPLATSTPVGGEPTPTPATGYTVPPGEVDFGVNAACPDCNMTNVALRKNFFADVGLKVNATQIPEFNAILPSMQRGDHDIAGYYIQGYFQTLNTFGMDLPPVLFYDIFLGHGILQSPNVSTKTTQDFLDEGKSFADAARAAVSQLKGARVASPSELTVQPDEPSIWFSYADMTVKDVAFFVIDDNKIGALAAAGRVDYAFPSSAAITVQLLNNGWKPIIDDKVILEHDTGPNKDKITKLVGSTGLFAQRKWVEANHDAALRFLSVMFRTIDYILDPVTQDEATGIIANIVNANEGTTLTPKDIIGIFNNIDPFWPWDYQKELWDNPTSPYYLPGAVKAQVQSLIDSGTLPNQEYDLKKFLVAGDLYHDLKKAQDEADTLLPQAASLTGEKAALVEKAKQLYAWHDYIDAVGMLKAALA